MTKIYNINSEAPVKILNKGSINANEGETFVIKGPSDHGKSIMELFMDINKTRNTTLVIVTHDPSVTEC